MGLSLPDLDIFTWMSALTSSSSSYEDGWQSYSGSHSREDSW